MTLMCGKTPPEAAEKAFQYHDPTRDEWFEEQVAAICRGEGPDLAPIVTDVWKQVINNPDLTPKFPKVGVGYLRMEAKHRG